MQTAKLDSRKFVSVDPSKCTGCGICEYAAHKKKPKLGPPKIKNPRNPPNIHAQHNHELPILQRRPCARACTEKAITQAEKTGLLIIDQRKCNGCDWCIQACPYGGLILDPDTRVAIACDLCDGEPKCIESCPEEALELVSDEEAVRKNGKPR